LEIGSNVGHFLKFLKPHVGSMLGVDPAENVCKLAVENGVATVCDFFNAESAGRLKAQYDAPDLIAAPHCFAHNANPHTILAGVSELLSDDGYLVIENAYALSTLANNEFDQIYHEHMFYFSIRSMARLMELNGFFLVDIMMAPIHGGSVVFIAQKAGAERQVRQSVLCYRGKEDAQLNDGLIDRFVRNVQAIRSEIKTVTLDAAESGKSVWTYGASAKGSTLLNYVGLTDQNVPYCADSTPIKHGLFLPQSNVEVRPEQDAWDANPDYFLLTAWNYKDEIIKKCREAGMRDSKFIVPIPSVTVL
jgi:SAM-dependent methyltransferase